VRKSADTRLAIAALACLLALSFAVPPALGAVPAGTEKPKVRKISLLYALGAGAGSLAKKGGAYTLTLEGLDRDVAWFSDRPARHSGTFAAVALPGAWKGFGFEADPPNAALVYRDPAGHPGRTVILELRSPRYAKGKLSFAARVLDPKTVASPNLADRVAVADTRPASRLADVSLFIDDGEAPVIDFCTLQPYTVCTGGNDFQNASLNGIDLHGANLSGATFFEANLSQANLSGAIFNGSEMQSVNLEQTNLSGASLTGVNLGESYMPGANLSGANLTNANLSATELLNVDFRGADLTGVNFNLAGLCNTTMTDGSIDSSGCR
jgi:hypothetical protein